MSLWAYNIANPFKHSSVIVVRQYVFRWRKWLTERSHSALVTESVHAIVTNCLIFGKSLHQYR